MIPELLLVVAAVSLILALSAIYIAFIAIRRCRLLYKALTSKSIKKYIKTVHEKRSKSSKKRYMVFEIIASACNIKKEVIEEAIKAEFKELFGNLEMAKANISVLFFDQKTCRGVIRFRSASRPKVLATLGLVNELNGVKVVINPLRVTGTLNKAFKYMKK